MDPYLSVVYNNGMAEFRSKGSRRTLKNGMTPKQAAFTKIVLKQIKEKGDINGTQAALAVYDTKDYQTANSIARENLDKPIIKKTIEQALDSVGLSSDKIAQNLALFANQIPEKFSAETVLKANIEILKLRGAYPNKHNTSLNVTLKQNIKTLSYKEAKEKMDELSKEATVFIEDAEVL
jgi:hypothetical protein